jgi:hypothetical protein
MKLEFFRQIFEKYSKFMKTLSLEAELFRADRPMNRLTYTDRQTEITKLLVAFRNFAKVPKIGSLM